MAITKLRIKNFKSFRELELNLGKFNVLVGSNASGKSNFVQIFDFLRNLIEHGLDNSISMQGGIEYLRNLTIGSNDCLSLQIVSDEKFVWPGSKTEKNGIIAIKTFELIYDFALDFKKRGSGFKIAVDRLTQKCEFVRLHEQKEMKKKTIGTGEVIFSRSNGGIEIELNKPEAIAIEKDDLILPFLKEIKLEPRVNLLSIPFLFFTPLVEIFKNISIYDFDPKLPKKATPITGKADLEEDGNNLAIVLKNIGEDKEKKRKLFNLVQDLLPFISNLDVEKFSDKSLLFKLQEKYSEKHYLPASVISDGTINITALIIALYFENKPITIIEEPERNLHPYLISKVVNMMKDASKKKQIIVTTHNPEVVKHAGLENILLVSRDKEGFTTISKPADKDEVQTFLKNEIGIEELYIQNLLGI